MSIQYSKNKKMTLPSVEEWGSDLGIVKDPSKGIFTKQKWYVSDTQNITETIDDSGDRIGEVINTYARGINPMTAVSYSNTTNNAGVFNNNFKNISGINQQASLVHKIQNFRPPILTNLDLLPLSRLPRAKTSAAAVLQMTDWTKTKYNQETFRQIKKDVLNVEVKPTITTNLNNKVQISEPFQLKYNIISDKIKIQQVDSGVSKKANILINSRECVKKGIDQSYKEVYARTNLSNNKSNVTNKNNNIDYDNYIQEANNISVVSNTSDRNKYVAKINSDNLDYDNYIQEANNISVVSNTSDRNKYVAKINSDNLDYDNYIQEANNISVVSNTSDRNKYVTKINSDNLDYDNYIQEANNISVVSNTSDRNKYVTKINSDNLDYDNYIQEANNISVVSNTSDNIGGRIALYDEGDFDIRVKDNVLNTYDYVTAIKGYEQNNPDNYNEEDYNLERILPNYSAETNHYDSTVYKNVEHVNQIELQRNIPLTNYETTKIQNNNPNNMNTVSRDPRLRDTLQLGELQGSKIIPKVTRQQEMFLEPDKRKLIRSAGESFRQRFSNIPDL
jgi:hypothetical protein